MIGYSVKKSKCKREVVEHDIALNPINKDMYLINNSTPLPDYVKTLKSSYTENVAKWFNENREALQKIVQQCNHGFSTSMIMEYDIKDDFLLSVAMKIENTIIFRDCFSPFFEPVMPVFYYLFERCLNIFGQDLTSARYVSDFLNDLSYRFIYGQHIKIFPLAEDHGFENTELLKPEISAYGEIIINSNWEMSNGRSLNLAFKKRKAGFAHTDL